MYTHIDKEHKDWSIYSQENWRVYIRAFITATPLLRPQMVSPKGGRNRGVLLYMHMVFQLTS